MDIEKRPYNSIKLEYYETRGDLGIILSDFRKMDCVISMIPLRRICVIIVL